MAYCAVVYVSEGLRSMVLASLSKTASESGSLLAHSFVDVTYNRTSYYLVNRSGPELVASALTLCKAAYELIDFGQHTGTHPSLGSVDHVCFSPLRSGQEREDGGEEEEYSLRRTGELSRQFSRELQNVVPIYLYGAASIASPPNKLKDIRRSLGYFDVPMLPIPQLLSKMTSPLDGRMPDIEAAETVSAQRGVMCVGACPLVVNFNMRFRPGDAKKLVAQVSAAVRLLGDSSDGSSSSSTADAKEGESQRATVAAPSGIVESLTLLHEDGGFESACNLRNTRAPGGDVASVLATATEVAERLGIQMTQWYTTGPTEEELLAMLPSPSLCEHKEAK